MDVWRWCLALIRRLLSSKGNLLGFAGVDWSSGVSGAVARVDIAEFASALLTFMSNIS